MTDRTVNAAGVLLELGDPSLPMTRRLMNALREAIRSASLTAGAALPPSRALADDLGCSRWVVTEAYGQLVAEGYLDATQGAATRVRDLGAAAPAPTPMPPPLQERRPRYDLAPGIGDLAAFPRSRWAECYRRAVLDRETPMLASAGLLATVDARVTLTDYLRRTRQVREDPGQLSLTTGASHAVGWLARLLRSLGHHRIAVEDPSWPGLRDAALRSGLQLVPIGVDDDGIRVEDLRGRHGVRALITTPAHQFPTGVPLSPERRLALIEWARQVDGLIIEDDYDAEFRYDRRPVSSLQGMAPDRVAFVGSVSKTLSPAVGLGWVVLPQWLIKAIVTEGLDRGVGPSVFVADALATMINRGWYEQHVRALRVRFRRRRENLVAAIEEMIPGAEVNGVPAGLHLVLRLPAGTDAAVVADRAANSELGLVPLQRYQLGPGQRDSLVLGFGNLRTDQERRAVELLASSLVSQRR